jgi:hypothetical protein
VRGIAAVAGIAREQRAIAQVLLTCRAICTDAARETEPWHSYAVARCKARNSTADRGDAPYDLLARNNRKIRVLQLAVDHMQVGAAYAARGNLH